MHDIICPYCNKAFKIDEAGYADILAQVRDSAFEQQLHERLELAEQDKRNAIELARAKAEAELQKAAAARDAEIQELKSRLEAGELAQKMAVAEAMAQVERERDKLAYDLEQARKEKQADLQLAEARLAQQLQQTVSDKDAEIQTLKARMESIALSQKLAVNEAVGAVEKERDELKSSLMRSELEKQLAEQSLKDKYETQLKDREDMIERLRDMKARL